MNQAKILIVEDEFVVSDDIEARLLDLGYSVAGKTDSGAEAIELAESHFPDLVLMDIHLRGPMDGITAATEIRQRFNLPVVFLTAYADDSTLDRAKEAEPFGYILKPFEDRELRTNIEIAVYKHKADAEIRRLNRLYSTLSQVNQAIVHLRSREELYSRICEIAMEFGHFKTAWIGLLDSAGALVPIAKAGDDAGINIGEPISHCGCTSAAIQQACPCMINELRSDSRAVVCREQAEKAGLRACAAYPIRMQNRVCGLFVVGTAEAGFFNDAETRLLDEVALDISFALDTIETERQHREAEEALRESEETNRLTFEHAALGIAHVAPDGSWLRVNEKLCAIVGYTYEELTKMNFQEITHPDDLDSDLGQMDKVLAGEIEMYTLNKRYIRKDRTIIWIKLSVSLVRTASRAPRYFISIIEDITARLEAEQEAAELQEKLAQSQKLEAIGQLAGGIAHDFNNLLMVIMAQTELLSMGLKDADAQRAKSVMNSARRAAELTGQLLAFSRKQTIQPRVTSMNQLVDGVSDMLQRLVREDIEVHVALHNEPWPVKIDRPQFEQVIINLVVNARDAMPDGGRLTIETGNAEIREEYAATHPLVPAGNYALLAVTDTGTGMSAEVQARLFEPFFTTKEPGKGTGLGLSMVYGIVKQSGGFIWVYSELGKGTSFKIYLPKVELGEYTIPEEHASQPQTIKQNGTILLVEDEENLIDVISDFLRSGGHKVIVADSLDEACRVALEHRQQIDLLLTDVILKGGNAKQLVHRLSEQGCEFRVVYMSGYTPNAIVHHGVLDPDTLFLQKPFSRSVLLDKVEEALS
jgi:PAS domain S-box-containing protein